jgi:hypothetical protein
MRSRCHPAPRLSGRAWRARRSNRSVLAERAKRLARRYPVIRVCPASCDLLRGVSTPTIGTLVRHVRQSFGFAPGIAALLHVAAVAQPTIIVDPEPMPARLPSAPRPKLVTASAEPPTGSIPKIMTAALESAKGERVELEEAFGGSTNRWISPKRLIASREGSTPFYFWTPSSALLVGLAHVTLRPILALLRGGPCWSRDPVV